MKHAVVEERFEYKGFPCVVIMQLIGFRTGYVGLTKSNKFFGKTYDEIDISCNGGLTYSESTLFEQSDSDLWWIGFDAGHGWNGYDYEALDRLFSDDADAMKQIESQQKFRVFYDENKPMSLEEMKSECIVIVEQIIAESEGSNE